MKASAGGHVNIAQVVIANRAILDLKSKVCVRVYVCVYVCMCMCTCIILQMYLRGCWEAVQSNIWQWHATIHECTCIISFGVLGDT